LYRGRGVELILRIAAEMKHCEFYIVGGNEEDVIWWNKNHSLKNIKFIGHVPHFELHKYYEIIDILLAPYQKMYQLVKGK